MARIVRTLERLNGTLKVQAIPCSARFDFTRFAGRLSNHHNRDLDQYSIQRETELSSRASDLGFLDPYVQEQDSNFPTAS